MSHPCTKHSDTHEGTHEFLRWKVAVASIGVELIIRSNPFRSLEHTLKGVVVGSFLFIMTSGILGPVLGFQMTDTRQAILTMAGAVLGGVLATVVAHVQVYRG
ncbi:hypothetical protein WCLP8_2010003 [uncultured Gammaproteobacteria bacterium]